MIGKNTLTLCPAEMKEAIQPYINNLFGTGTTEIESIEQEKLGCATTQCFVIKLKGTEQALKGEVKDGPGIHKAD